MSTRMKTPPKGHEPKKEAGSPTMAQKAFQRRLRQAGDEAGLAGIYFDDGAYLSAARCYRKTADMLDKAHAIREAALAARN